VNTRVDNVSTPIHSQQLIQPPYSIFAVRVL